MLCSFMGVETWLLSQLNNINNMKQAKVFTNYSDETFTHSWDKVEYSFKAGQSMMLEDYLCLHMARHLAIRELNKRDVLTSKSNILLEMKKAIEDTDIESENDTELSQKVLQANSEKEEDKKVDEVEESDELSEFEGD